MVQTAFYFIESVDILFVFSFDVRVIFALKRKAVAKRRFCLFSDIQYVVKLWSLTFILSITVHVISTFPSLNFALKWNHVCLVQEQSLGRAEMLISNIIEIGVEDLRTLFVFCL